MSRFRSRLDVAAAAGGLFLVLLGSRAPWLLVARRRSSTGRPTSDYGDAIVNHGLVPYRDFAVEYPPGALPVFVLPAAFHDYADRRSRGRWRCAASRSSPSSRSIRPAAAFYVALAPVLAGSLILSRFDLWPALLAVAALAALLAGGTRSAGRCSARRSRRSSGRSCSCRSRSPGRMRRGAAADALAGLVVVAALAFVPFAIVAPHGLWTQPQRAGVAAAADREPRRRRSSPRSATRA